MQSFAERYRSNPMVQEVQYSQSLAGQLSELIRLVRVVGAFAIVLMLAVTAFVIATTIRLALYSHRQELQIMRLVGARGWFIKTPFLIEGMAEGFLGAVAGLLLLWLGHGALIQALSGSELARAFQIEIGFLAAHWIFLIVLLGPLLGLIGSYLAVRRFAEE
jgi:cell division transport system permease protein